MEDWEWVVAHEYGHLLGLADGEGRIGTIMRTIKGKVTNAVVVDWLKDHVEPHQGKFKPCKKKGKDDGK